MTYRSPKIPHQPPRPKPKHHPVKVVAITLAALVGLCCTGNLVNALVDDDKPAAAPSPSVGRLADQLASVAPTSASPTASPPPTPSRTASPTPKPKASPTRTPRPNTTSTRTSSPKPKPARTTSSPSIRTGVHPGAFCKPAGALGRTSTGKLMVCKRTAEDERLRWRAA